MYSSPFAFLPIVPFVICTAVARADVPVVDERIGDPSVTYIDPEFWGEGAMAVWQELQTGEVWSASINLETGHFVPVDGRGRLMGVAANISATLNGPEFGFRADGPHIYYSARVGRWLQLFRSRLDRFPSLPEQLTEGDLDRFALLPSRDRQDEQVRLAYFCGGTVEQPICWSWENEPTSEKQVVVQPGDSLSGPHWIHHELALLTVVEQDRVTQVGSVNALTGELTILTSDDGEKKDPFYFEAPEFGGERLLMCVVDLTKLAVYRKVEGQFTRIYEVSVPGERETTHNSAEPFIFDGRSYASVAARSDLSPSHSDIWLLGLDPLRPFAQKTNGPEEMLRVDPETLIGETQLFVYYYRYPDNNSGPNELHVCRLTPPGFADLNQDGNVDEVDGAGLPSCLTGPCGLGHCDPPLFSPAAGFPLGCRSFDEIYDGDVDLQDIASMQNAFVGSAHE